MTEELPPSIPRYAIFRDRKCRVIEYTGGGWFRLIVGSDTYLLHRSQFTFVKEAN